MMVNFRDAVEKHFSSIISKFHLILSAVDDGDILLIGDGFALDILCDMDNVIIGYICHSDSCSFSYFPITSTIIEDRFDRNDRSLFGTPAGMDARIDASLRVYASGLLNHCQDILSGDKKWLEILQNRDPKLWSGRPISYPSKIILLRLMSQP